MENISRGNIGRHFQGVSFGAINPGLKPWAIIYYRFAAKSDPLVLILPGFLICVNLRLAFRSCLFMASRGSIRRYSGLVSAGSPKLTSL